MNYNRNGLLLQGPLDDQIASDMEEMKEIIFAEGFGRTTDMQVGPDGNLYILTSSEKGANIHRIIRTN
ncbi:MAG: hypothetical protein ABJB85_08885 [Nitrososphaerota archaeon]